VLTGGVVMLVASVQCSEDLSRSESAPSTPVFYACGSRLFKCSAIYDVNHSDNRIVSYIADDTAATVDTGADVNVLDRICPYCDQLIAGFVSQADYERHIQSHVDFD